MNFLIKTYKDADGKWHRDILGPLSGGGTFDLFEACHANSGIAGCPGFADKTAAEASARKRIDKLTKAALNRLG